MEGLLSTLLNLLSAWCKCFSQERVSRRAIGLALGLFLTLGRKNITRWLSACGLDQIDWSAFYRFFSRRLWSPRVLFRPIIARATKLLLLKGEAIIAVAYDDSLVKKTGKRIKGASWQRDPLSPHFSCNFVWGMRYLQASLLMPLYNYNKTTPPRALPIQFEQLPKFKRPSKRAREEDWSQYHLLTKRHNLSTAFVKNLRYLRHEFDLAGLYNRKILAIGDGSFANKTCLQADIPRTHLIVRTKKNARLYRRHSDLMDKRRFYDPNSFTPEDIRKNEEIPFRKAAIFYSEDFREVRYKELKEVYWKWTAQRKPLRLIVIGPTPCRRGKNNKLYYRDPAYLLTTDLETDVVILIQKYFDRWQIEVNFKEEKDLLGLGKQQVWSERSIPRLPAFVAACYSSLLLASILRFNDERKPEYFPDPPKWYQKDKARPSLLDILAVIRREILENDDVQAKFFIKPTEKTIIERAAS